MDVDQQKEGLVEISHKGRRSSAFIVPHVLEYLSINPEECDCDALIGSTVGLHIGALIRPDPLTHRKELVGGQFLGCRH